MRMQIMAAAAAILLLAGCERSAPADDQAVNAADAGNYQERLMGMEEGARNAVFIRAIRDADAELSCQGVTASAYIGDYNGLPMWTARCDDGTDWALLIGPSGTTQVTTCRDALKAGLPPCTAPLAG